MNGKTIRAASVFCTCAVFLGCTASDLKQDVPDPQAELPIGSEVHPSAFFEPSSGEEGIYVETFHGPVRLIGLMDSEWERDLAFDFASDADVVDVHTDLIPVDGACQHVPEAEERRGL